MKLILLILFSISSVSFGTVCINEVLTSTIYSTYADYFNDKSYCGSLITYPITDDVANNAENNDSNALSIYQTVVAKWKARASTSDDPTNDCLGVTRAFACATQFPSCELSGEDTRLPMCSFLCTLFIRRCPAETAIYEKYCYNARDGNCSHADHFEKSSVLALLVATLYLLIF